MHVTDWAAAQREDPVLDTVLRWLEAKKKTDLRTLLGEHASSEQGWMVWRNHQNFTNLQNALYLCSMPKGANEDLLCFVVPKAHWTATLNGCHKDTGHQGCDHMLSLLQEHFWWPGMVNQMTQSIKACTCCLQYEGGFPKALLCPIVATAPLELLHIDSTSIKTMLGPHQLPRAANILVFQDHFTKHVLAYVNPNQTVKTVTKFLYWGYISLFEAPTRLLSDRHASFSSSVVRKCAISLESN